MAVAPTQTLVVQTGGDGTPVLAEPVRLVNPDGTDWTPATGDTPTTVPEGSVTATAPVTATRDDDGAVVIGLTASTTGKALLAAADGAAARQAIGAGTSSFSGSYADLTNRPGPAAAVADLASDADVATTVTTVNKILAALRARGVIAK